ncbi:hypothetical protein D9M72_399310 [compost metagenome]
MPNLRFNDSLENGVQITKAIQPLKVVDQHLQVLARRFLGCLFERIEIALPAPEFRVEQLLQLVDHIYWRSSYHAVEDSLLRACQRGFRDVVER